MKVAENPISDDALQRYFDESQVVREPSLEKLHSRVRARQKHRTRTVTSFSLLAVVVLVAVIWVRQGTGPDSLVTTSPNEPDISEPATTLSPVTSTEAPSTTQEASLTAAETYRLLVNSTWTIVELENLSDTSLLGTETLTFSETNVEGRLEVTVFDGCRDWRNLANVLPDTVYLLSRDEGGYPAVVFLVDGTECLYDSNERLAWFGRKLPAFGATISIDTSEDPVVSFTRDVRTVKAILQSDED